LRDLQKEQAVGKSRPLFEDQAEEIFEEEIMKEIFEFGCATCGAFFLAVILSVLFFFVCMFAICVIFREEKDVLLKRYER